MKHPLATTSGLAFLAGISLVCKTSASVTIDWVTVGNAGNAADPTTGYGAVNYEYRIGKYEVTNAQYVAFLNAKASTGIYGLYSPEMDSYGITRSGSSGSFTYSVTGALANRPVVLVSWFDAARFANWMANGQGSSDTETGSYTLNVATSGIITANAGAQVYIPSEDEWYKAAYYNGATGAYSLYPNGQNVITIVDANYSLTVPTGTGLSTDVGSYLSAPSYYGTFDQGGNVEEWNDAVIGDTRGRRGGSWNHNEQYMRSTGRDGYGNPGSLYANGFRLAAAVPEPGTTFLTMVASGMMLIRRKR
jgi:sulfatase modifying factor 1